MIVKSKRKLRSLILLLLLIPVASGFVLLSFLMLRELITTRDPMLGILALMLLLLGSTFLFLGVYGWKKIEVDYKNQRVVIVFLGLFRKVYHSSENLKFNNTAFVNNFGRYDGILIEDQNEFQYQFSKFDTKNLLEVREAVQECIPFDEKLSINFIKPILKPFLISCIVFLVLVILGYSLNT